MASTFTLRRNGIRNSVLGRMLTVSSTDRFGDFRGALQCLTEDAKLKVPPEPQGELFEE